VRDAFAAWKEGLPAVVLVHEPFVTLATAQCQSLGARDPLIVVYKQDAPARDSDQELDAKASSVAAEVLRVLRA
jgi:hypothetical protein